MFMAPSWSCSSINQNKTYLAKLKFWLHVMLYNKDFTGFSLKNKIWFFFLLIRTLYLSIIIAHFFILLFNAAQQWLQACSSNVWNRKNHRKGQWRTEYPIRYNHAENVTEKQRKRKEDKLSRWNPIHPSKSFNMKGETTHSKVRRTLFCFHYA